MLGLEMERMDDETKKRKVKELYQVTHILCSLYR